jgi:hypothetical protein
MVATKTRVERGSKKKFSKHKPTFLIMTIDFVEKILIIKSNLPRGPTFKNRRFSNENQSPI